LPSGLPNARVGLSEHCSLPIAIARFSKVSKHIDILDTFLLHP
jgi:hypothetical protein